MQPILVEVPVYIWVVYHLVIISLIGLDLLAGRRIKGKLGLRDALKQLALWLGVGISFGLLVLYYFGLQSGLVYFTAYTVEYTLSFENLLVFAIIFSYFSVPAEYQNKTLYVGIISAILMRASFILAGLKLLQLFQFVVVVFGLILIYSGYRLASGKGEKLDPGRNPLVRIVKRIMPLTDDYVGSKFIAKTDKGFKLTPLVIVLLVIETTDIVFAFDSVPAVIAITENFFLAYTSNINAILGIRSLYSLFSVKMFKARYLGKGLAVVLIFLGIKMILSEFGIEVPISISIIAVLGIIAVAILLSVVRRGS